MPVLITAHLDAALCMIPRFVTESANMSSCIGLEFYRYFPITGTLSSKQRNLDGVKLHTHENYLKCLKYIYNFIEIINISYDAKMK
jgi:hypothetical protein